MCASRPDQKFIGFIHKHDLDDVELIRHIWVYQDKQQLERFQAIPKENPTHLPKFEKTDEILVAFEVPFTDFVPIDLVYTSSDRNICEFYSADEAQMAIARNIHRTDENLSFDKYIPCSVYAMNIE